MIIGYRINKINVNAEEPKGQLEIKANVKVDSIKKKDFFVAAEKKPGLEFGFNFTADYGQAGKISVDGFIFYIAAEEVMDEIEKKWTKDKKVDDDRMIPVLNKAMHLGYTEAIVLADRVRLPSPLRMPRVSAKKKEEKEETKEQA